ncbi:hypothetical protein HDU98_002209 [Podochytrium sp. JEL0797]|nr:hypothetical protein HDU98_002209 [Podochytrium sp. JEL0797]
MLAAVHWLEAVVIACVVLSVAKEFSITRCGKSVLVFVVTCVVMSLVASLARVGILFWLRVPPSPQTLSNLWVQEWSADIAGLLIMAPVFRSLDSFPSLTQDFFIANPKRVKPSQFIPLVASFAAILVTYIFNISASYIIKESPQILVYIASPLVFVTATLGPTGSGSFTNFSCLTANLAFNFLTPTPTTTTSHLPILHQHTLLQLHLLIFTTLLTRVRQGAPNKRDLTNKSHCDAQNPEGEESGELQSMRHLVARAQSILREVVSFAESRNDGPAATAKKHVDRECDEMGTMWIDPCAAEVENSIERKAAEWLNEARNLEYYYNLVTKRSVCLEMGVVELSEWAYSTVSLVRKGLGDSFGGGGGGCLFKSHVNVGGFGHVVLDSDALKRVVAKTDTCTPPIHHPPDDRAPILEISVTHIGAKSSQSTATTLFEPFLTPPSQLDMPIARALVSGMGGTITTEVSKVGQDEEKSMCCIRVEIPITQTTNTLAYSEPVQPLPWKHDAGIKDSTSRLESVVSIIKIEATGQPESNSESDCSTSLSSLSFIASARPPTPYLSVPAEFKPSACKRTSLSGSISSARLPSILRNSLSVSRPLKHVHYADSIDTDSDGLGPRINESGSGDRSPRRVSWDSSSIQLVAPPPRESFLKGTILIVDDSSVFRHIIRQALVTLSKEFVLHEAVDGVEALQKVAEIRFDFVFMDLEMPNMNGHATTKKMRALGFTFPIIAITAHNLTSNEIEFLEDEGMTKIISKPISKVLIFTTLEAFNCPSSSTPPTTHSIEMDTILPAHQVSVSLPTSPVTVSTGDFSDTNTNSSILLDMWETPHRDQLNHPHHQRVAQSLPRQRSYLGGRTDIQRTSYSNDELQRFSSLSYHGAKKVGVLVVDDSFTSRHVLGRMIEDVVGKGWEVVLVDCGWEAVRECCSRRFELIFMDLEMPGMDGDEACVRIRAMGVTTPIIAVTGNIIRRDDSTHLRTSGVTQTLVKPVSRQMVKDICDTFLTPFSREGSIVRKEDGSGVRESASTLVQRM